MNAYFEGASPDCGPFGRPLFDDPSARALARVGVVDVGSNSVRLVVFDGAAHVSAASIPALASRSFVISSFGKTYHVTGWKVGYVAAPAAFGPRTG